MGWHCRSFTLIVCNRSDGCPTLWRGAIDYECTAAAVVLPITSDDEAVVRTEGG